MPRQAHENTLRAFALALDAGADGIELDVHATADGVVVVHHDGHLVTGRAIASLPSAQLGTLSSGDPIPTLEQVCELVDGRAELFVEIKGAGIEAAVASLLDSYGGECAIHSFDHALIERLHHARTAHTLGVLLDEGSRHDVAALMERCGASDVWPHHSLATADLASLVHARAGRVIAWTVNDRFLATSLAAAGIDGLCSDDVNLLPA
ncbi:MAG: glycerophosphodiester phosphodiesterase [Gemmatimonadaceae bacterium]